MACYFNANGDLIMRRGDSAVFTIETDTIPFERYETAYFAVIDRETLEPVLPELYVPTTEDRRIEFTFTKQQTELLPQPKEAYDVYGYTFKLCAADGTEDTFIPEAIDPCCSGDCDNVVIKKLPKVLFYPKVIEGDPNENSEE